MIYRFYQRSFSESASLPLFDYEVANSPKPVDWSDPQIFDWHFILDTIHYALFRLGMFCLRKSGSETRRPGQKVKTDTTFVTVDDQDLIKVLMNKLDERQLVGLSRSKSMILCGAQEWSALMSLRDEMLFMVNVQFNQIENGRDVCYFMGVPVVFLPDFVGIAVVPDFTGLHVQRPVHFTE